MRSDMKNLVEELESKITNFGGEENMEEKRKVLDKSKKGKKPRGDEMLVEEPASENKENVHVAASQHRNGKSKPSRKHRHQTAGKRNDDEESVAEIEGENGEGRRHERLERPKRNVTTKKKQYMEIEEDGDGEGMGAGDDEDYLD